MADADAEHRELMVAHLVRAADRLGVTLAADPVYGWYDRTIGARATGPHGERWLRLVRESEQWTSLPFWTGNTSANTLTGVRRPKVLDAAEWSEQDTCYRAELMELVQARPVATQMTPDQIPALEARWWADLRSSLDALAAAPTKRACIEPQWLHHKLLAWFGVSFDPDIIEWSTAHGDLHWANLTAPELWLLDWESWGTAPAGYDAAFLYCVSLTEPMLADKVDQSCADLLHTRTGAIAQLAATARLAKFIEDGQYTELAVALHANARALITQWEGNWR